MSFLGGWLGPALNVLNTQRAGQRQGELQGLVQRREWEREDAETERQIQRDALQRQLLELNIQKAQTPDTPWGQQGFSDEEGYLGWLKRKQAAEATPVQPDWAQAGYPDEASYLDYLGKKERVTNPREFAPPQPPASQVNQEAEGIGILNSVLVQPGETPQNPEIAGPFARAFRAIRQANPTMQPGLVAKQAMASIRTANPALFRQGGDEYAIPEAPVITQPTPATTPVAPDNQEAMAQRWDELVSQGVDPEEAKAQVLREFGGQ